MISASRIGLLLFFLLALMGSTSAEIPGMISYQGRVTDGGGSPVADGSYDMEFRLFNALTGGVQRWESGTVSVQVTGGIFSVLLGESPQPLILLDFDEDLWLQVTFDGAIQSPRQNMASVGYAYMASGLVPGTQIEEAMYGEVLQVHNQQTSGAADGITVRTNSTGGYAVIGIAEATSGLTRGVYGRAYSASARAVMGYNSAATGDAYGVYGETSSTAGMAVFGWATASTGVTCGGYFETGSTSGSGVRGVATATTGVTYGVYGRSYSTTASSRGVYGRSYATTSETYGVIGQSDSHLGMGVYGSAPSYGVYGVADRATFAHAVQGATSSTVGVGVYGSASATSGDTYGVYGRTVSPDGIGVRGMHELSSGQGTGVAGRTNSPDGFGVYGVGMATTGISIGVYGSSSADGGTAVWAEASAGSNATGIIARGNLQGGIFHDVSSANWAACGRGSYKILGTGSVDFVQNHPYNSDEVIVYAAPEGDEVATYTRGTARLVHGEATVSLGETFKWVTNPDIGLTAHLTPRGRGTVLFVESLTTETMTVRSLEGFANDVVFDYLVYGLRVGFEEATVVQKKEMEAYIPSMEDHREMYAAHPHLRRYNALERHKGMLGTLGAPASLDLSAAQELKNAVREFDPNSHPSIIDIPQVPESREEPSSHIGGERPARDVMEAEEMSGPSSREHRVKSPERDES